LSIRETNCVAPEVVREIEAVLDQFRQRLRLDGADLAFVALDDGLLRLRMTGSMSCCAIAVATLRECLASRLRQHVPSVTKIELEK
jgi:Fe-S cluster biogenesis protein NfuA